MAQVPDLDVGVAEAFWAAQRSGGAFPRAWHDRLSFEEAYRIQLAGLARRVSAGGVHAGWKVAQTSEAGRAAFGFREPVFGFLLQGDVRRSGHVYGRCELVAARCEPEVCVRLRSDLDGAADADAVRGSIDLIFPALEIIEARGDIAAQKALAIADNAATREIVLGAPVPFNPEWDLAAVRCRLRMNDDAAREGSGADVMGDPLNAVGWLAAKLARFGLGLRRGDLVMTGSLTSPVPFRPGDRADAAFGRLGRVSASRAG